MLSGSITASSIIAPSAPLKSGGAASGSATNPNQLTDEQKRQLEQMKARDREVRQHEQAHKTIGGPYAGAISYETETGPDGREYAVAGEVPIDVSPVSNNAEATIRKMDIVERAALAPAEPSPQDRAVAAQARTTKLQAQAQLQEEKRANETEGSGDPQGLVAQIKAAIEAYQKGEDSEANSAKSAGNIDALSQEATSTLIAPAPISLFA